jgi:hypothetical protein
MYGQGLTYSSAESFRKPSTPDSLYKEGKFHLRAGIALTITGPVELGAGLFFMVSSGIGKDRTSTGLIGLGSALCIIGAVSTVLGPIAINRGRKEIKLGRKQQCSHGLYKHAFSALWHWWKWLSILCWIRNVGYFLSKVTGINPRLK